MLRCLNASLCSWQLMLLPIRGWGIFWFYKLVWKMDSVCCSVYLRGSCGIKMKCFHETGACCHRWDQGCRKLFYGPSREKVHLDFPQEATPLSCNLMGVWGDNYLPWGKKTCTEPLRIHWKCQNMRFFKHLLSDTSLVSLFPLILVFVYSFNFQEWLGKINTTGHKADLDLSFSIGFGWVFWCCTQFSV